MEWRATHIRGLTGELRLKETHKETIMKVMSDLFLFFSTEPCWKCELSPTVVTLGCSCIEDKQIGQMGSIDEIEEIFYLHNIADMPEDLFQEIQSIHPRFKKHYSKTSEFDYFANFCECGANFGDYYLFNKPDGAFFPTSAEAASKMSYLLLPNKTPFLIDSNINQGSGMWVLEMGKERHLLSKRFKKCYQSI